MTDAAVARGRRVAQRRQRLGMTMLQLAEALDVHEMTVWRWEHRGAPLLAELALDGLQARDQRRARRRSSSSRLE